MSIRKLKISTLWQAAGDFHRRRCAVVPQLRIAGRWLEAAGFTIGENVCVHVEQGQLVITTAAK